MVWYLAAIKQKGGRVTGATAGANEPAPARPEPSDPVTRQRIRPAVGDTLIVNGAGMAGLPLLGTILAIFGDDGAPPYLVRWTAGDYESRVFPGAGARIEKHREKMDGRATDLRRHGMHAEAGGHEEA